MLRVYIAGAAGAHLAKASVEYLSGDPRVEVVGYTSNRVDAWVVRESRADVLLSATHHYVIDADALAAPRLGTVGLHPGMLPRYRGSYPLWWALVAKEREVGLSLFRLTEIIDAGPVLRQYGILVDRNETFGSLYSRVSLRVADLLDWMIQTVETSSALPPGTPQDEEAATTFPSPSLRPRVVNKIRWTVRANGAAFAAGLAAGAAAAASAGVALSGLVTR